MSSSSNPRRPLVAAALQKTRKAFLSVAAISAVTNVLMLVGPLFMMQVYDRVLTSKSIPTLVALSILTAGLYLFQGVFELIRSRILARIGHRIEEELTTPTFDAVMILPLHMSRKEAMAQPLRDLDQIRQFMGGTGPVAICDMPWLPVYLAVLFLFHSYLGWLAVAGAVTLLILTIASESVLRQPTQRLSQLSNSRTEFAEAGRRNAEAIFSMGMRQAYSAKWRKTNDLYVEEQRGTTDAAIGFTTASKIFRLALQSAVLALGAWLVINQMASPGAMIASSILTSRALAPIEQAVAQWRGFINARQATGRLRTLLEKLAVTEDRMSLPSPRRSLQVTALTVSPPGNQKIIISDISFALTAGQAVGVIGPSGSGKSTLARALVGVWRPAKGTIRLDGAEINQWDPEVLGASIGYLSQGVELFGGSIAENIARFDEKPNPNDIIEAAKLAGVHDLILSLPNGYDTQIGSGGEMLSAGQRQRVGLARALYRKPFLIVLDEPNASLDAEGETALVDAIAAMRSHGSIIVIIAHRPNALAAVDHALVLAQGKLVAFGPRDEVLRKTTVRAVGDR